MLKLHYALGFGYLGLSAVLIARAAHPAPDPQARPPAHPAPGQPIPPAPATDGAGWFARMKPYCNAVEVETAMGRTPPPAGQSGAGWGAACLGLAGKIDRARQLIRGLPEDVRPGAAGILFNVAHPVADAGDDRSAGPMMALVAEFWPANYMALYHAGMSEYALGQPAAARDHLGRFVELYRDADGWRSNALTILQRLGAERPR
jgi:hypothetical protein